MRSVFKLNIGIPFKFSILFFPLILGDPDDPSIADWSELINEDRLISPRIDELPAKGLANEDIVLLSLPPRQPERIKGKTKSVTTHKIEIKLLTLFFFLFEFSAHYRYLCKLSIQ